MGRRVNKSKPDYFASRDASDHNWGRIYEGMVKSSAYQKLSLGARHFFTICRIQANTSSAKRTLYNHCGRRSIYEDGGQNKIHILENYFVFPASHLNEYGYDRSNASKYFKELKEAGFIDIIESNQHRHQVNVYAFSNRWKTSI